MSALDDLLAQRAAGNVAAFPQGAAAPAPATSSPLDAMLAAKVAGTPLPPAPAPGAAPNRTALQLLGDGADALQHNFFKPLEGATQFVQNTIDKGLQQLPDNPVSRKWHSDTMSDNAALAQWEREYQASTPDGIVANSAGFVGGLAPWVMGGIPNGLRAAGEGVASRLFPTAAGQAPSLLAKVASGTTQGAIVGASEPVFVPQQKLSDLVTGEQPQSYWDQKLAQIRNGAVFGGAVPVITSGVGALVRGAKSMAAPVVAPQKVVAPALGALLTRDGQVATQDVVNALRSNNTLVPGSGPTTAQVLAANLEGGHPQAVMAEKAVANTPEGKLVFADRDNANNAARIASLEQLAGSEDDMAAAIQARKDATQPFIAKALTDPAESPDVLKTSQPIRASLITGAIDKIAGTSFGTDPVIAKALKAIRTQVDEAAAKTDTGAYTFTPPQLRALKDEPYVRPDLLDGIRQNLRNTISDNASNGAVSSKQEAGLQPLADRIASAIDDANPGYSDYLAAYAKHSQPINSMEAARSILANVAGGGRGANSAGDAQVTLPRLASALGKALKGSPYELDPKTQGALEAVQSDLQRASISNSVRAGSGSDTAFNLQAPGWLASKVYGPAMTGKPKAAAALGALLGGVGGWFSGGGAGAAGGSAAGHAVVNKVAELGQQRTAAMLARAMAEPEYAAELLSQAQPAKTALPPPGVLARLPAINALLGQALQRENP